MIGLGLLKDLSRADFLTSVGLYVASDRLFVVRLRKTLLNLSILEQEQRELPESDSSHGIADLTGWVAEDVRDIALKGESDVRERALKEALLSLLPIINAARNQVFICLPQDQAIVQHIYLPLAAQDNVAQVLGYEIERQLPFKRDEIYYDYLPVGRKGEKLSVYVFAIPKKNLYGLLAALDSFGIKPVGVETTATALANYLLFTKGSSAEGVALVAGHPNYWELIGVAAQTNGWKPAAELLFSHRFPAAGWAHGAGQEALQECWRQVPKVFRCGALTALDGLAADRLGAAEEITSAGQRRLGSVKAESAAEAIPAIGAALRGVREASLRGNFLHEEVGGDDTGKNFSLLNRVLSAALSLGLIGWAASFPIKDELRLRQLQRENQKLAPAVGALRREDEQLERLGKELSFLRDLEQRRGDVLRVLDELTKIIPNSAYLSNLRYRSGVLEIQGSAENASALIPLLERSPVFENVNFNAPSNRGRDNRETFSLKADIEKSKEIAKASNGATASPPVKDAKANP
jgi:Tfp pilus assembly protein PilN